MITKKQPNYDAYGKPPIPERRVERQWEKPKAHTRQQTTQVFVHPKEPLQHKEPTLSPTRISKMPREAKPPKNSPRSQKETCPFNCHCLAERKMGTAELLSQIDSKYLSPTSCLYADFTSQSNGARPFPKADYDNNDVDRMIYKNSNYGRSSSKDDSECRDFMSCQLMEPKKPMEQHASRMERGACRSKVKDLSKSPNSLLASARKQCEQMNQRFCSKYASKDHESSNSDSSTFPSQKTVISGKSGEELRSMVRSQIEMQELIRRSITNMTERKDNTVLDTKPTLKLPSLNLSDTSSTTKTNPGMANKSSTTSQSELLITKADVSTDVNIGKLNKPRFSVSAEDMISSKVISPMIRRIQRMYLNNLKEEMSLIEELERVPCQVSEVYQSADDVK